MPGISTGCRVRFGLGLCLFKGLSVCLSVFFYTGILVISFFMRSGAVDSSDALQPYHVIPLA